MKKIVESFEQQVNIHRRSSVHSHRSAVNDEKIILGDLRELRPFKKVIGRDFESFQGISADPTKKFNADKFQTYCYIILFFTTMIVMTMKMCLMALMMMVCLKMFKNVGDN